MVVMKVKVMNIFKYFLCFLYRIYDILTLVWFGVWSPGVWFGLVLDFLIKYSL